MNLSLSDRRVWLGILLFALVIGGADVHGFRMGAFFTICAIYFFKKHWDTGKNYVFYFLVAAAIAAPILRYNHVQVQKQEIARKVAEEQKTTADAAEFKRNIPAGTCEELRRNPRSIKMVEQMCYRMYPSDSLGDSAARSVCANDEYKTMKACEVDYLPDF